MKANLIAGEWRYGGGSPNINPSDITDVIGDFAQASVEDATDAIASAQQASAGWAHSDPLTRHKVLSSAAREIAERSDELGRLLSREEGKTLLEGTAEVVRASQILDFFAGETLRLSGELAPSTRPGVGVEITREPIGVVGIITPWNFPMAIPAWKIAPALAYGCTVVFKPAELVPACAWALVDALHRAGLPPGVLNLVMGRGSIVGQAILDDPRVEAITFTGSQATGRRVAYACAANMRRCQLEMGGKNPLVILDDADLDVAVNCAIDGAFYSTGQRCTASSRLIVTERIHNRFIEACIERLRRLRVGHALSSDSDIGPVVDQTQLNQDLEYIEVARREGGSLRYGGDRPQRETEGYFLTPALITETRPEMRINREEVFGPVASVIRVRDYDEALAVANDTEFGLSSGICTTSLKQATHFKRNIETGMVMVNLPTAGVDPHVPFGGRKGSNLGPREQGRYAIEFFTEIKTAYTSA